ncbi:MAG: hypothetical protein K9M82_07955 [Deltaproteobacteria bacterium]|nr:hypothetical protein [Deltaproteobacteria bacterium]
MEAIESSGYEFYYSLQLIGNSLLKEDDLSALSIRYAGKDLRDTYTLIVNSRYPINDMWRINPRMQVDYRIIRYALQLDTATAKRLGWVFEDLGYSPEQLDPLLAVPIKGYRCLDPTGPRRGPCNRRWMIQENLPGKVKR